MPPRRPIVAIVPSLVTKDGAQIRLPVAYAEALLTAGGAPLILPVTARPDVVPDLLAEARAVLLTGGPDLDPARYGQEPHPETKIADPRRTAFDLCVLEHAEARRLRVLAICGGLQLVNVARGGTLHQHLETDVRHCAPPGEADADHSVTVSAGSLLAEIVGGGERKVNSAHHQAADRLGCGLSVSARAPDGVVEALEDPARPFYLAVQWHPERLPDHPETVALFQAFVRAAATGC